MLNRYLNCIGCTVQNDAFFLSHVFDLGQSKQTIGLHSLRAGGATMAANAGVNNRCWERQGRWKGENSKDGCGRLFREEIRSVKAVGIVNAVVALLLGLLWVFSSVKHVYMDLV